MAREHHGASAGGWRRRWSWRFGSPGPFILTRVAPGDRLEIVEVDGKRYVKGGDVYTSAGNFVFDVVLLVAEITGFLVCLVLLIRRRR